jgi:hypothetical protein
MSRRPFRLMAIAACAGLLSLATHAQGLPDACKADVKQHCASAKPGGGRVVACLQQHEADLSPNCKTQLPTLAQCSEAVRKVCGDVGARKLRECVKTNSASLGDACKAAPH